MKIYARTCTRIGIINDIFRMMEIFETFSLNYYSNILFGLIIFSLCRNFCKIFFPPYTYLIVYYIIPICTWKKGVKTFQPHFLRVCLFYITVRYISVRDPYIHNIYICSRENFPDLFYWPASWKNILRISWKILPAKTRQDLIRSVDSYKINLSFNGKVNPSKGMKRKEERKKKKNAPASFGRYTHFPRIVIKVNYQSIKTIIFNN